MIFSYDNGTPSAQRTFDLNLVFWFGFLFHLTSGEQTMGFGGGVTGSGSMVGRFLSLSARSDHTVNCKSHTD